MAIKVYGYTRYGPLPVPGVYTFVLSQEADASSACSTTPNTTFYSASPTLGVGSFLYSDVELTVPAPNFFWYSNGTTAFRVSGGAGEITSSEACTTTTTTSTTSTTTTAAPTTTSTTTTTTTAGGGTTTTTSTTTTTTTAAALNVNITIYDDTCTITGTTIVFPGDGASVGLYYRIDTNIIYYVTSFTSDPYDHVQTMGTGYGICPPPA